MTEKEIRQALHSRGYIVQDGWLKFVENDDPDNYQLEYIAEVDKINDDLLDYLERAGWPQYSGWDCPGCGNSLVYEIGEYCHFCKREAYEEAQAEV